MFKYGTPMAGGVEHVPPGWDWWIGLVSIHKAVNHFCSNLYQLLVCNLFVMFGYIYNLQKTTWWYFRSLFTQLNEFPAIIFNYCILSVCIHVCIHCYDLHSFTKCFMRLGTLNTTTITCLWTVPWRSIRMTPRPTTSPTS